MDGYAGGGGADLFDDVAESPPAPESDFDRSPKTRSETRKKKRKQKVAVACVLPVTLMKACAIPPPLP